MCYSLIKPGVSTVYKRTLPEKKNFTFKTPIQTPKIIVQTPLIPKNENENDNKNDNTTSVRININPEPFQPDSSLRAHMIAMLFI
jgi:hypothetical protein